MAEHYILMADTFLLGSVGAGRGNPPGDPIRRYYWHNISFRYLGE